MAKEPRPEDLKSSQRRTGSHNGGSDSELGAGSPRKCGVRGRARGLEAAAMGKEGSSTTSSSVGEGSGKNILGGGEPSFCCRKAKWMFTAVAEWIGHFTYDRPRSGRPQVGGRGEQRRGHIEPYGVKRARVEGSLGFWGFLWHSKAGAPEVDQVERQSVG